MEQQRKLMLRETLKKVSDLQANLENALDNSLINTHIDVNPYIKLYNKYLNEVNLELEEDGLLDIITQVKPYDYTGNDFKDTLHVKEKFVDIYWKSAQLMGYIENKLEFGES